MKKFLPVALVLALALLSLVACSSAPMMKQINAQLHADYSQVDISVFTEQDGVELTGDYTVTFDGDSATVTYAFDVLNKLDMDGGNPDGYIRRVEGEAKVVNGVIEGENIDLNVGALDFTGFSFKEGFFSNVKVNGPRLDATVTNPKGFVGNNAFSCSDMRVMAVSTSAQLKMLRLSYVSQNNASVQITYSFTV